jgi:hypothetical protein
MTMAMEPANAIAGVQLRGPSFSSAVPVKSRVISSPSRVMVSAIGTGSSVIPSPSIRS